MHPIIEERYYYDYQGNEIETPEYEDDPFFKEEQMDADEDYEKMFGDEMDAVSQTNSSIIKGRKIDYLALIKMVRNNCNKKVPVYDYWGNYKCMKSLPIYYSDTEKYCFPSQYFKKEEVLGVKKEIEKIIKKNNWN